jgi:HEAT repeat protein
MRYLLLAIVVALTGCAKKPPLTAGGKPVSHWLAAIQGPDAAQKKKAVRALGHVGPADPAAIPALVRALKDPDANVRAEVALALLNLGPAAKEAIPALEEAQNDGDETVRAYAAKALERVRGGR